MEEVEEIASSILPEKIQKVNLEKMQKVKTLGMAIGLWVHNSVPFFTLIYACSLSFDKEA